MKSNLEQAMEELNEKFFILCTRVEENLKLATESFLDFEYKNKDKIIENDHKIDELEVELEETCLKLLAMYQPVASDLRYIIAILKINNDLERIGDLSVGIITKLPRFDRPEDFPVFYIPEMVEIALKMFRQSIDSFVKKDTALALEVCELDDKIDALNYKMRDTIILETKTNPKKAEDYLNLFLSAKNLERVADLSTNIAEDVIYINEGKIIRHGQSL